MNPTFLTLDEVLAIHESRIRKYGGSSGVRDLGLLESAIGTPEATFGGVFLHETLFAMAAAYLFHIAQNHPFVDGNKRTALACALAFLRLNGVRIVSPEDDLYDLVIGVAEGRVSKAAVAVFFEGHAG
ncbi:MAG TPA: type II toxin-antitoxin system death-on-curing family toxin [Thermoanaerobaculia bacterium]|nr:type II toxin-antitoxin system death-on-curing family toxin [Thermoanaerobaculia bacterium]